ncbi:MAG: peptide chain release factor-like protein [Candidatus Hydrogenedentes bacterium]|nr:peptide chain release factor-like protein [Candidatus Hydrogenedentota bacterium]
MSKFGVSQQKEIELLRRMESCGLREADLVEQFVKASGPGGQHVNKTQTGVLLTHRPTGLEVKMTKERSQALNRFFARRRLCELIEIKQLGGASPEAKRTAKLRKQKDRRRRRAVVQPGGGEESR